MIERYQSRAPDRRSLIASLLCLALSAVALSAQTGAENFDRWWTPQLEALTAAPQNHKVLFENDEVRVLEVNIPPHSREPMHVHRYPATIYIDSSPHLIEHLQDGTVTDRGKRPNGTVRWLPIDQGHFLENVDAIPLHAIRVELKKFR